MQCIKTGAVVHLKEYNCYVIADLYMVNDVLIIRNAYERSYTNDRGYLTATVSEIEHWFDDKPHGVILARKYSVKLT